MALHSFLELLTRAGFGIILSGNFTLIAFNYLDSNLLDFIAFDKIFFTTILFFLSFVPLFKSLERLA